MYLRMFVDNYIPADSARAHNTLSDIQGAPATSTYHNPFERQKSNDETFVFTKRSLIPVSQQSSVEMSTSSLNDWQESGEER